ncbi:MAG: hypothetical protein KC503_37695 [Myxococcales bacterium]|nr:hypothetical protein [Myxococcales bacterium]
MEIDETANDFVGRDEAKGVAPGEADVVSRVLIASFGAGLRWELVARGLAVAHGRACVTSGGTNVAELATDLRERVVK